MDLIKQLSVHLVYLSPTDFNHLDESITQLLHSMIMNARRVSIVKGAALKLRIHNKCQVSTMGGKPNKLQSPLWRCQQQCTLVDEKRCAILYRQKYIGQALDDWQVDYKIPTSEVSFSWQIGLQIGRGRFGIVYSCVNQTTGSMMGVKIIYFHKIRDKKESEKVDQIADEINNVKEINHENLVKVYGAELNRCSIYIFLEFCGLNCTLERLCKESGGLSEELVREYTNSLLRAVEALHDRNIIHRDIKPQNIFLKEIYDTNANSPRYILKLGDFGCSFRTNSKTLKATGIVGTTFYMAPEIMLFSAATDDFYSFSADIWSVGCVVIEMFSGLRPWHPLEPPQISYKLCIDKKAKPAYPNQIKDETVEFLERCIQYEAEKRFTAEQLLSHTFLKIQSPKQTSQTCAKSSKQTGGKQRSESEIS